MNRPAEPMAPPTLMNVEAEAALLGGCMIDNRIVSDVAHILKQTDFAEPMHGRVWRVLLKMVQAGKVANPVSLRPVFESDPAMAAVGGVGYLAQLTGSGAAVIGARSFAEQIRDLSRMRAVRDAVDHGLDAIGEDGNLEDFLVAVEIATSAASADMRAIPMLTTRAMVDLAEERAERSLTSGTPGASCKTIRDIDTLIGKLEGGQMTLLAGRPGMGKSTTAVSAALGYGMNGHPGIYALAESSLDMFSLKMTADLLHAAGREIPFRDLKEGILTKDQRRDLVRAAEVADSMPVKWAHIGRSDVNRLEALVAREALRLKREDRRLEWLVVDYLQLLTADGRHRVGDDRARVNAVSEALLKMAERHNIHIIALSQLSRAVEARDDKRPRLSDLRESGRLEEDADNVLMVFREEYYLDKTKPGPTAPPKDLEDWELAMGAARGKVEILAPKTRFGVNASRKCHFLGEYSAVRGSNYHQDMVEVGAGLFDPFEGGNGE